MGKFIINEISIPVREAYNADIKSIVNRKARAILKSSEIEFCSFEKKSIDARHKGNIQYIISAVFSADDDFILKHKLKEYKAYEYETLQQGAIPIKRPIIIGAGPCGLFAAYLLSLYGYNPLVIERGKRIEDRHNDVMNFFDNGKLDTESNIQFGEGGAGAYSDGKLVTRINDPRCSFILSVFNKMGADESILYEAKPHIGSDILKTVVAEIRKTIICKHGSFMYESKVTDIIISKDSKITGVVINNETQIDTDVVILATGHSARDTYQMLYDKTVQMTQKPFSVGFRIEHLAEDINDSVFGKSAKYMPQNAEYQLSDKQNGRGVYSFCMCPGGYVINASSEEGCLSTNGMSLKNRDGINSNSAWVVSVDSADYPTNHPLAGIEFQRLIERKAYQIGQGSYVAGVQGLSGFLDKQIKRSNSITPTIRPGFTYADLSEIYNADIYNALSASVVNFERRIPCFGKGVLTACETRTSSPVNILRDEFHMAPGIEGLYPCGEGAGKAGGIMSAAVDGLKTAEHIIRKFVTKQ